MCLSDNRGSRKTITRFGLDIGELHVYAVTGVGIQRNRHHDNNTNQSRSHGIDRAARSELHFFAMGESAISTPGLDLDSH